MDVSLISNSEGKATALIAAGGASLAACIAGTCSLLALLSSKELETSKFRQVWIDELRKDIAELIARANHIQAYHFEPGTLDYTKFWKETREDYLELNKASTRIKLRLNQSECPCRLILQSMSEMELLFKFTEIDVSSRTEKLQAIVRTLEQNAPPLLKEEWKRVKAGELPYRIAKWITGIAGLAAALLAFALFRQFF